MAEILSHTVRGRITVVQEQRFRLQSDSGQGLLFTLAHDASAHAADLHHFLQSGARVIVEYTGEPNLASGAAYSVRAIES